MDKQLRQTEVVEVEKAAMPFLEGESLQDFVNSLKKPCGDHLEKKGLYNKAKDAIFPAQVFHNRIMVEVDKGVRGPYNPDEVQEPTVYELKFKRDAAGNYTFVDEPTEMMRRIQYVPKAQAVQKSMWNGVL